MSMKKSNKFIILEGGDGSGKGTQTKLLIEALQAEGQSVKTFDFPQYESSLFGKLCGEALKGMHGDFLGLSPYLASLPYTLDRVSARDTLNSAIKTSTVICNRYTPSNVAYQAAKLSGKAKKDFINFLEKAEYGELGLPEPDAVIYLYVPGKVAHALVAQKETRGYLGKKGARDVHEKSTSYQEKVIQTYLSLAKTRKNWHVVRCVERGKLLSREEIHARIRAVVSKIQN